MIDRAIMCIDIDTSIMRNKFEYNFHIRRFYENIRQRATIVWWTCNEKIHQSCFTVVKNVIITFACGVHVVRHICLKNVEP